MAKSKIGFIVGSNRRESINRKLTMALIALVKDKADFEEIEIADLPMFNQDMENSPPPVVPRFKAAVEAVDGLLIVTPEHNRSISALLKNAIDWGTRPYGTNNWGGKTVAVTGTSQGVVSTALAQSDLRRILSGLGAVVMGGEAFINFKPELLDASGRIANEDSRKFLRGYMDRFVTLVEKLEKD